MITILYSIYTQFDENHNVQIKKHPIKKDKTVFRFRGKNYECEHMTSGSYSNIIQDANHLKLYYRVCCDKRKGNEHQFTCIAVSNDYGGSFVRPQLSLHTLHDSKGDNNIILQQNYSCHNFSVCYNVSGQSPFPQSLLLGIGGTHHSDKHNKTYKVIDYVWPHKEKNLLSPYIKNTTRDNGLYLYESNNGFDWKLCKNKPIFHGLYTSKQVKLGMVAFDTLPKLLYNTNTNKYMLYTRANTGLDIRSVIYSETTDFVTWTEPEFITIQPPFNYKEDNIYFLGGFHYPNTTTYIAFSPFFKTRQPGRITFYACTKIMYSYDGKHWITLQHIFERQERYKYDIAGFIQSPDGKEFYLFFHENVYTYNNTITRYKIRKDGFTSLYSEDGFFTIKVPAKKHYFINYKTDTENNGFIVIEFLDAQHCLIQEKMKCCGNEVHKPIQCNISTQQDHIFIRVFLHNSHVYSISY